MKNARFLLKMLGGYRWLLIVPLLATFAQTGASVLSAFPLKFIFDKLVHNIDPSFPMADPALKYFDRLFPGSVAPDQVHSSLAVIFFAAAMLAVVGALTGVLSHIQIVTASHIGRNVTSQLRNLLFEHLQGLPLGWHGRQKHGDLVQRVTGNIQDIEKLIIDGLVDLLAGILTLIGMVIVMLLYNWQFALLSIVTVPPLFLVVLSYTRSIKSATKQAAKSAGHVASVATEAMSAITEVKAFTLEEREQSVFQTTVERYRSAGLRAGRLEGEFNALVTVILAISTVVVMGIGAYVAAGHAFRFGPMFIAGGTVTIGTVSLFLTYLKQLYQPMRDLSKLTNLAASALSAAERIQEVLDERPEMVDSATEDGTWARLRGEISFRNVTFGYRKDVPVLRGVNLDVRAGERVALVGLSGSGKTTLVKLIPRFFELWGGEILIDGHDSRQYPLEMVRQNVGFVLQDSVLFEGTIRDNLAIGRPAATDDEIEAAARKAHIHDDIMRMPAGYDAQVLEHGKNFSGGQRQRLAIARALVRDAPILVLDEPTASLDVEAEAEVMRAIEQLVIGRTVLMITHRLSTIGQNDRVVVLDGGEIVESGTPGELRRAGGVFARIMAQNDARQNKPQANAYAGRVEPARAGIARAFLQDILADGPVRSRDILTEAGVCGVDHRTLVRARRELGVTSSRSRGGEWYWLLPVAVAASRPAVAAAG